MSDSYKKNAFCSYAGSKKNKQIRNRRNRSRITQYVNTCRDWESFLVPDEKSFDDPWADFDYGCNCRYNVPAENECEVEYQKDVHAGYNWRVSTFNNGHFRWCNCYTNKKSRWWKAKRK